MKEIGKLQPQAVDVEEALLGVMLSEPRVIINVLEIINEDAFYKEAHQFIFSAIKELHHSHVGIDLLSVTQQLRKVGKLESVGGAYVVTALLNRATSSANVVRNARIIKEKQILREMIKLSVQVMEASFNDTVDFQDVIDMAEKGLTAITSKTITTKIETAKDLYKQALKNNDILLKNDGSLTGVTTGFTSLDSKISGWQGGDLIILAARPGMGKTALALQFLSAPSVKKYEAHEPGSTAIFSLEMQNRTLYARLIAQNTNIPLHNILKSGMNQYQLQEMLNKSELLGSELMSFDDTGGIKLFELVNKARKLKRDNNIKLLVIDYIQLIENSVKGGNREQEVSSISRALKSLAKELDIPIIALAQLSRANEKRTDKTPLLSDLRESGSIEQDADIVMFLHRPEYYGIEQDEFGNSTVGKASLIFAKHRNGGLGVEDLNFDAQRTCFSDINIFSGAVNDVPY